MLVILFILSSLYENHHIVTGGIQGQCEVYNNNKSDFLRTLFIKEILCTMNFVLSLGVSRDNVQFTISQVWLYSQTIYAQRSQDCTRSRFGKILPMKGRCQSAFKNSRNWRGETMLWWPSGMFTLSKSKHREPLCQTWLNAPAPAPATTKAPSDVDSSLFDAVHWGYPENCSNKAARPLTFQIITGSY